MWKKFFNQSDRDLISRLNLMSFGGQDMYQPRYFEKLMSGRMFGKKKRKILPRKESF